MAGCVGDLLPNADRRRVDSCVGGLSATEPWESEVTQTILHGFEETRRICGALCRAALSQMTCKIIEITDSQIAKIGGDAVPRSAAD